MHICMAGFIISTNSPMIQDAMRVRSVSERFECRIMNGTYVIYNVRWMGAFRGSCGHAVLRARGIYHNLVFLSWMSGNKPKEITVSSEALGLAT